MLSAVVAAGLRSPPDPVASLPYFEFLGLEPKLRLDSAALQKRFYELSRQWHPDRFARKSAAEQQQALDNTALLNDAFRTLKDPVSRAEYVLSSEGFDIGEQRTKDVPPELLEEVFELNMALDEMRSGDESARPALEQARTGFAAMLDRIDRDLDGQFASWDTGRSRDSLQAIRGSLNRRKYIANLVRSVDQALSERQHGHVSN
ncbi:MAG: Fe-S protein assembly co-chaperone HscB [Bryobacteraceae bacterium]